MNDNEGKGTEDGRRRTEAEDGVWSRHLRAKGSRRYQGIVRVPESRDDEESIT